MFFLTSSTGYLKIRSSFRAPPAYFTIQPRIPAVGSPGYQQQQTQNGPRIFFNNTQQITNADQGALFSWQAIKQCYSFATNCVGAVDNHLTSITGGALAADVIWDVGGYQPNSPVTPILQVQDGSYVGSVNGGIMIAFDASGNVKWASPNYSPSMATADGGIIATAGGTYDPISHTFIQGNATTFDASGSATGQLPSLPTYSWKGAYQLGSIDSVTPLFDLANMARTFAPVPGGNLTGNGFSCATTRLGWCFATLDREEMASVL